MTLSIASVNAAQLASMRGTVDSSLPSTCNVIRDSLVSDGAGGAVATPTVVITGLACRFGPFRVPFLKQIEVTGTRIDAKTRWEFVCPLNSGVDIKDRIQVTSGDVDADLLYEVASLREPQSFQLYDAFLLEQVS